MAWWNIKLALRTRRYRRADHYRGTDVCFIRDTLGMVANGSIMGVCNGICCRDEIPR